jgi:BlaI family penicillinase repressor
MFSVKKPLSNLEQIVLEAVWERGSGTTETIRETLAVRYPMKESTARTILRRLEDKGYVWHEVEGRFNLYRGVERPENLAAKAVGNIIQRFCGGSVEKLLLGMVKNNVIDEAELQRLAQRIASKKNRAAEASK